uniref:Uncharacterized protein n=1 Tax=Molossus molossus TaxID=27622 RepID=A0A7J8I9B5_MOLMO|nr:hypothetical protein HJG59_010518 [Molossus molossus]
MTWRISSFAFPVRACLLCICWVTPGYAEPGMQELSHVLVIWEIQGVGIRPKAAASETHPMEPGDLARPPHGLLLLFLDGAVSGLLTLPSFGLNVCMTPVLLLLGFPSSSPGGFMPPPVFKKPCHPSLSLLLQPVSYLTPVLCKHSWDAARMGVAREPQLRATGLRDGA